MKFRSPVGSLKKGMLWPFGEGILFLASSYLHPLCLPCACPRAVSLILTVHRVVLHIGGFTESWRCWAC